MRALPALLLVPALSAWALPRPPLSLEEACSNAGLVVVGTLGKEEPAGERDDCLMVRAKLGVSKVLYGKAPEDLRLEWGRLKPGPNPPPACWDGSPLEAQSGTERVWCLRLENGAWSLNHPGMILPIEKLKEVDVALQQRLEPFVQVLLDAKRMDLHAMPPPPRRPPPTATQTAFAQLAAAGPAALPGVRRLLASPSASARAWGCEIAARLNETSLAGDLAGLLGDGAKWTEIVGDVASDATVGAKALEALGHMAGKPFGSGKTARIWARHGGALCRTCADKGIVHYLSTCRSCGKTNFREGADCCAGPHAKVGLCEGCAGRQGVCFDCGKPLTPSSP